AMVPFGPVSMFGGSLKLLSRNSSTVSPCPLASGICVKKRPRENLPVANQSTPWRSSRIIVASISPKHCRKNFSPKPGLQYRPRQPPTDSIGSTLTILPFHLGCTRSQYDLKSPGLICFVL